MLDALSQMQEAYAKTCNTEESPRSELESQRQKIEKRIEYLRQQLDQIENLQRDEVEMVSPITFWLNDEPLSCTRIAFKISELEYKWQVQSNLIEGYEKLAEADEKQREVATKRIEQSRELIEVLKQSHQGYVDLVGRRPEDEDALWESVESQQAALSVLDRKETVSGLLELSVGHLHGFPQSNLKLQLWIDGECCAESKVNEPLLHFPTQQLSNNWEVMLQVRKGDSIIAVAFFRLSWILEERKALTEWSQRIGFEPIGSAHLFLKFQEPCEKPPLVDPSSNFKPRGKARYTFL